MRRCSLLSIMALLAWPVAAQAQIAPFDMSPELSQRTTPQRPVETPALQLPQESPTAPGVEQAPALPPVTLPPADIPPADLPDNETVDTIPMEAELSRYFLPGDGIRLEGEAGRQALDVYLTEAQAMAPATLDLEVLNSILVAPEMSRLGVSVNGTSLTNVPVAFANQPTVLSSDIPQGVLNPGLNRFEFTASQRHRTDCSVTSTYELWSDLYSANSRLSFANPSLGALQSISDLPAIGMTPEGETNLRFYVPGIGTPEGGSAALNLVQHLALATRAASVDVVLLDAPDADGSSGVLTVILATASELPQAAESLSERAIEGPLLAFLPADIAPNTLVVSGPDWADIAVAIASLGEDQAGGDRTRSRVDLPDNVPLIEGRRTLALSELGVQTVQFNGRRYTTDFRFAMPADFYASMYSEAELILDAAYSAAVLPGSELDVYVNGQIAAVFPVLRTDGGTFRNSRLRIPMTNFIPGVNRMHIEIILQTREDEICGPGASGRAAERFLFSSGSQLAFPDFGRMATFPDLRAMAGAGAPYAGAEPVQILVADDTVSMRSSMMLLARVALSAGEAVSVTRVAQDGLDPVNPAFVVGPLPQLEPSVRERGQVIDPQGIDFSSTRNIDDALDEWRRSASATDQSLWEQAQQWFADRFDLQPDNFWLIRRADGAYVPQSRQGAILSQSVQAEGGVWTYLTIPDAEGFNAAVDRLMTPEIWWQVDGRVSAIGPDDESLLVLQPRDIHLVATQPWTLGNLRLVAANWLSTNVLVYALALGLAAVLLTMATTLMLNERGGRHK